MDMQKLVVDCKEKGKELKVKCAPFYKSALYCVVCVAWVVMLPFGLVEKLLKGVKDVYEPK